MSILDIIQNTAITFLIIRVWQLKKGYNTMRDMWIELTKLMKELTK